MSLTKNQIHERIGDLAGLIKAAESEEHTANQRRTEQQRLLDIAEEGAARAADRLHALLSERANLVEAYAAAVLGVLDRGALPAEDEDEDEELQLGSFDRAPVEAAAIQEATALFEPSAEPSDAEEPKARWPWQGQRQG